MTIGSSSQATIEPDSICFDVLSVGSFITRHDGLTRISHRSKGKQKQKRWAFAVGTRWTFFLCEKSYKSTRDRDTHTRSIASVSFFLFLFPSSYSHPSEFALLDENSTGGPLSKMSGDHARRIVLTSFYLLVWFFYWRKLCWTV